MSYSGESDLSASDDSDLSDDQDYPWQDEIGKDGGIFYVEESLPYQHTTGEDNKVESDVVNNAAEGHKSRSKKPSVKPQNSSNPNGFVPTKTVFVSVNPPSHYNTRFSSLLREMLGIISLDSETTQTISSQIGGRAIIVTALVPDGPTMSSDVIEIGDVLLAINNVAVNHSNVEQVLDRVPHKMELQLTIMCDKRHGLPHGNDSGSSESLGSNLPLFSSVSRSGVESGGAVFFLTLNVDSESARGEEDIIYMFPRDSDTSKFRSTRGIFSTLADVSVDAFRSGILGSTMLSGGKVSYCMYHRCGSDILVLCTPPSLELLPIHGCLVDDIAKLLKLIYQDLSLAFSSKNWNHLDHIFNLYLSCLVDIGSPPGGLETVSLNDELTRDIDISLTEYEASDFDDGFHNPALNRRIFSIVGTCLFYQDMLIASHVPPSDVSDFHAFCQSHLLFNVSERGRILIWREVFPNRSPMRTSGQVFKEADGRFFYLIIGLRGCLLCVLLKCRRHSYSTKWKPEPPTIYINHGTAVILNLESLGVLQKLKFFLAQSSVSGTSSTQKRGKFLDNAPFISRFVSSHTASSVRPVLKSMLTRNGLSLYFLQFPDFSGALISDPENSTGSSPKPPNDSLVKNFNRTAAVIHNRWKSLSSEYTEHQPYEEGALFHLAGSAKPSSPGISYWVVGRFMKTKYSKEFYVCFPDGARQDVMEIAFKMGFGFHDNIIA